MEENIAILIADLTGYTALTETHGSVSAADLIDKYLTIVENCLVGDSRLHERKGDEVMIVSRAADSLLATALMIMKETSNEENFLQVHGALHYGKVLKRINSYFGSALNLTARIAAKANPGTFWCSGEFVNTLSDKNLFELRSKGKHNFKNINAKSEIFEIRSEGKASFYIDPICRMLILKKENATKHPESEDIFFCSSDCLDIYMRNQLHNSKN